MWFIMRQWHEWMLTPTLSSTMWQLPLAIFPIFIHIQVFRDLHDWEYISLPH